MAAGIRFNEGDRSFFIIWIATCLLMAFGVSAAADEPNRQLTREETEAEIKKLWEKYVEECHRKTAYQVGSIYARYSTKYQSSILDQVRVDLEFAAREGIYVPLENIFFDLAVSGRKKNRPGLHQLEECLKSKQVKVLIVFTTNRLYRRAIRALEFVERLVKERKKRVVFVMNNIDSEADDKWKRFLSFLCLFDEFAAEMYVESIRAAHVGKLLNRQVYGTLPLGYHGVPIPGSVNRKGKPNLLIEIHEKHAQIVRRVFHWFATEDLDLNEIIRRLNAASEVPAPPKSKSGEWTRLAVKTLLKNERYRGQWSYGETESILIADKDYIRQDERDEPLATIHFEELRITSDEIYYKTQKRLAELDEAANRGRKPAGENSDRLPKILNGLLYCPEHDQRLHVGGPKGEYMICPACHRVRAEERYLFSQLNRQVALQRICSVLGSRIQNDTDLVQQIVLHCQTECERLQKPDEGRLEELKQRRQKLKRSIGLLMRQEPDSNAEEQELEAALREKRSQLAQVEVDLTRLESIGDKEVVVPTADDVASLLSDVSERLSEVAENGAPDEISQLRELLRRLTGGRIELTQQGERKARKGWLQGRFRAPLLTTFSEMAADTDLNRDEGIEIVVDFKRPDRDEELQERAWELYQEDLLEKEIADILGCCRGNVTRLLKKAAEIRGVELEDGRIRRSRLQKKQIDTPQYQLIADEAVNLWNEGKSYREIGREVGCSDATAEKAIAFWHESRGLPVPTATSRREDQKKRAMQLRTEGLSDAEIARRMNVSATTIRNWLNG